MDERTFAVKEIEMIYLANESLDRAELIFHLYSLLEGKNIKYQICCEKLNLVDPIKNTQRFLDIVYALYLYLDPNTATMTRCLKSENSPNSALASQASRMIEKRFTNKFGDFYLNNSEVLIRSIHSILDPLFNKDCKEGDKEENSTFRNIDLRTIYWIVSTEKIKLDNQLIYYDNPLVIFNGPISSIFEVLEQHQIESYADAFNFIERLKSIMLNIHHIIQFMEKQRSLKGVEIPTVVAQNAFSTIQGMLKLDASQQKFLLNFKETIQTQNMDSMIYDLALEITKDSVYRALYHFGDLIKELFLEEDDVPQDNNENENENSEYSVCCDRNRGSDYYSYCLRHHTTTEMTAEEIHNLGLQEVETISKNILENTQKYIASLENSKSVETFEEAIEFIREISLNPQNIYPDSPEGETMILNDIKEIDSKIKEKLDDLFVRGSLPQAECEYKFTPEHQKESMPAGYYYDPSFDGKNKGSFFMNLSSELLRFSLPTLVAHEAIPGHHFQLSTVAESDQLHPIRKVVFFNQLNAYVEGWALYTEKLGLEIGLYDTPLTMVGHLMDEMLRAARLVIDTGIHHYGWSRQKAIDYMNSVCPYPLKTNEMEIDRYIGWPGQATSYKIGQLKILDSRKERLNDGETLQEFNTQIIAKGAVPLDMLNLLS